MAAIFPRHDSKLVPWLTNFSGQLSSVRGPLDGIHVYSRKKGETAWRFLDSARYSPFVDAAPAATPGIPEIREYRVVGVYKDQEVGQPSDIVSVTVGD